MAQRRSLAKQLAGYFEWTTIVYLHCSRRHRLPAQNSNRESLPTRAKCFFRLRIFVATTADTALSGAIQESLARIP